jgi:hypothetical protein
VIVERDMDDDSPSCVLRPFCVWLNRHPVLVPIRPSFFVARRSKVPRARPLETPRIGSGLQTRQAPRPQRLSTAWTERSEHPADPVRPQARPCSSILRTNRVPPAAGLARSRGAVLEAGRACVPEPPHPLGCGLAVHARRLSCGDDRPALLDHPPADRERGLSSARCHAEP